MAASGKFKVVGYQVLWLLSVSESYQNFRGQKNKAYQAAEKSHKTGTDYDKLFDDASNHIFSTSITIRGRVLQ